MPVSVPTFIKQAWAAVGTKFTIPDNANPATGRAGWDQGFSPINLTPVAAGGIPPFGQDMNGVLYDITSAIQYIQAGRSFPYNQDFADAIGGYGKGSLVSLDSDLSVVYKSKIDNNLTPPPSANWEIQGIVQTPTNPIQGISKNLKLSASGTNSLITITSDQIILEDQSGDTKKFSNINLSINTAAVGLNGLDTGLLAVSTWYSVWVISDGVNVHGLISLSDTTPDMPDGYTYKAKVWDVRTDGTANKFPLGSKKQGNLTTLIVAAGSNVPGLRVVASGVAGGSIVAPTWATASLDAFAPQGAISALIGLKVIGTAALIIAPNPSYGGKNNPTNPPWASADGTSNGGDPHQMIEMPLETSNLYWASNISSAYIYFAGWRDSL